MLLLALITPVLAATVSRRDLAPASSSSLPSGWQYSGCYEDSVSARSLSAAVAYDNSGLTAQSCIAFCASKGYPVAGTEYSTECYCGAKVPRVISGNCNMPCTGDNTQACGGPNALSVYSNPSAAVSTNPGPPGWTSQGCWTDNVQARSLGYRANTPAALTVQLCTSACQAAGYTYAGVEYSSECYCGNTLGNNPVLALSSSCTMTCSGNATEYCGGPDRLNLYQISAATVSSTLFPIWNPANMKWTSTTTTSSTTVSSTTSTTSSKTSSSTTTTAAAEPTCTTAFSSYGQVYNGGFEQGLQYWTIASSSDATGQAKGWRDAPPYEGCSVLVVTPSASTSGQRSFSIYGPSTINPGQTRTLSFYVGRRSGSTPASINASVNVNINGNSGGPPTLYQLSVAACSGSTCNLVGSNGSAWKQYTYSFTSNYRAQLSLQFTVFWGSGAVATDGRDDVLIDGIVVS